MKRHGQASRPPGPGRRLPGLTGLAFIRDRIAVLQRLTSQYGDIVAFDVVGTPFAVLNHPDYVRDVLVTRHRMFHKGVGLQRARLLLGEGLLTSEGTEHQRHRRLIQPAFHRDRIATYGTTMVAYADRAASRWQDGETRDVLPEMSRLTLAIAGKTLFDTDVETDAETIGRALTDVLANFNITLLPFGDRLVRLPIPHAWRFRRAKGALDAIVYRLIAERRTRAARHTAVASGDPPGGDILSILVAARDEGDGRGLSDEEVRDEVLTLLLAGHETTANALTWTWYLLAGQPAVRERMEAELGRVCGTRLPTAADVAALPYTRAVLAESMRLFPPAYIVGRRAREPYAVPNTDYVLPAGTVILLSQYLLHRDPRFWDAPGEFRPERWLGGEAARHRYAYFPFGAGPRICIGEHFAWMEGVLVLATIARQWRLDLAGAHPAVLEPVITLRPKGGIRFEFRRRR